MSKQTVYNAGIYVRLSQEDLRAGESLSIENQRLILTRHVAEQGWNLVDEYVDDGYSGTDFERPSVKRLLEDAKNGRINLILVKDLSRFGRNYIQVGQYIDYIFPMYNIRFVALGDNVDTINSNSTAMDMMPIVNIFNEWHCASTSRKMREVFAANAKIGKYFASFAPYGYVKGNDELKRPVIDPPAAEVVRRIFTLRSQGMSFRGIANVLNDEHILSPNDYKLKHGGVRACSNFKLNLWGSQTIKNIIENPAYIGNLAQLKRTTVSYKNHKSVYRDKSDWVVVENSHEPIISRELWDKCQEVNRSLSKGKINKDGEKKPLSGLLYCADCGCKMKLCFNESKITGIKKYRYICGAYSRIGKNACTPHNIQLAEIENVVLSCLRSLITIAADEESAKKIFLARKHDLNIHQSENEHKYLRECNSRLDELNNLIQATYEDKVLGKIPEKICIELMEKYQNEKESLTSEIESLNKKFSAVKQDEKDVDEFIRRLKCYSNAEELTREMCLQLIEYVTIGDKPKSNDEPREINVYYKFLDKPYEKAAD